MPREVNDGEGTRWTCVQAYAGLSASGTAEGDEDRAEAARVEGGGDRFRVVCTPSGQAQTVRLELPVTWLEDTSDDELRTAILALRRERGDKVE